jgi:hypothetical protein
MLTIENLESLFRGDCDPIQVGEIPNIVSKELNIIVPYVYLSLNTAQHIFNDHPDIDKFDLLHMPFAIRRGMLLQECRKPRVLISCYQTTNPQKRFITVMKRAAKDTEIWISTFHRAHRRQTISIQKRAQLLKKHD